MTIKGKIRKENAHWVAEIRALGLSTMAEGPLLCLKTLEELIQFECTFKIQDKGDFYLIVQSCPSFIEYVSERLVMQNCKGLKDLSFDGDFDD